ncbi:unnamed protein product [Candida verbasci]|uniref:Probable metalloprotease ARX1 n=1 Tax=Candida verbasci TaxID=1227364 RepID=A0A9W4TVY1_9ASCO|nr:unnamed protein product [Candida verbasci]
MSLAIHQDDADILLKQKNILNEDNLEKYRVAGQITQTGLQYLISLINNSYHLKTTAKISVQDLCLLSDSFLFKLLNKQYVNKVIEKGISHPTTINVNELINGFAPEIDDEREFYFKEGDVVTLSLGVQIDGYTSQVSHTIVIYPTENNKPTGPLLGNNADAICACHIAIESVIALLGCSLNPEKLPQNLQSSKITGSLIRNLVDSIADQFNCIVLPGSKIRRIRRFLAGQAEGIVAERDFKGVVWDESHQEIRLLKQGNTTQDLIVSEKPQSTNNSSAVPNDEFFIEPGEVYQIDLKMSGLSNLNEIGIITTDEIDQFSGKNNKQDFNSKSSIFIRDFAITHQLKLKTARKMLGEVDKKFSVYPFKLDYIGNELIDNEKSQQEINEQIAKLKQSMKSNRLGASELINRHLIKSKPIQITKFVPLKEILLTSNPTGKHGIDLSKPVLPGMEIPLPNIGISSIKLKSLLKTGFNISNVRESTTIIINNNNNNEVLRLNGGEQTANINWIHSNYKLNQDLQDTINYLIQLTKDKRFGINLKTINPYKLKQQNASVESMQID